MTAARTDTDKAGRRTGGHVNCCSTDLAQSAISFPPPHHIITTHPISVTCPFHELTHFHHGYSRLAAQLAHITTSICVR